MFWLMLILLAWYMFSFLSLYVIDIVTVLNMRVQKIDTTSIETISKNYIKNEYGITVNKPIVYRFVKYKYDKGSKAKPGEQILLGTFHKWNGKYYIDISVDLYNMSALESTVIHETRHLLVEYLKDEKIINLEKYSEQIAQQNSYFNNIFDNSMELLKNKDKLTELKIELIAIDELKNKK